MPCQTDIIASDEARDFENLLCQACKYLSREQVASLINHGSGICHGLEWYVKHLFLDAVHSESSKEKSCAAILELQRMGYTIGDYKIDEGKVVEAKLLKFPYMEDSDI